MELEPDWGVYYQRFVELSYVDQAVATVGVTEASLMRMAHGAPMQGCKRSIKGMYGRPLFHNTEVSPLGSAANGRLQLHELGVYTKRAYEQLKAVAEATIPEFANALCDSSFKGHVDAGMDVCCNGAGRIVLDRAEETAFQALGATIPHSLSQSLYARVERPRWPYLQSRTRARPTFIALTRKTEQ
ncbi:helicase and polymerase-containing protein TEBICHI-like isoform X3 [Selaginella moellendorffii]|uniref:helicase and polymerase-containing protein TEBICHI-like isoform X3 n=1 Tax=Selaginella moellendorffii TaxID=88036 RepID=UPI000D1C887F|nr:helicase and polymerase-containing protein TEBICHI-like isoform X3 [Selaginella moellendorffii]|eukprot:XP_024519350.1 helicase and polymerase-containing protein TEBICHI-like isoform X3 [Selaginella moellendorffii]